MAEGAPADVPSSDVQGPPVPDMASFQANEERMVAAAVSKQQDRGRMDESHLDLDLELLEDQASQVLNSMAAAAAARKVTRGKPVRSSTPRRRMAERSRRTTRAPMRKP